MYKNPRPFRTYCIYRLLARAWLGFFITILISIGRSWRLYYVQYTRFRRWIRVAYFSAFFFFFAQTVTERQPPPHLQHNAPRVPYLRTHTRMKGVHKNRTDLHISASSSVRLFCSLVTYGPFVLTAANLPQTEHHVRPINTRRVRTAGVCAAVSAVQNARLFYIFLSAVSSRLDD